MTRITKLILNAKAKTQVESNQIKFAGIKHKAANQHLHEVSEYLKTLNTYYNKQLIDGMVKSKEKFNKSKSVVNQKYINFHEYASAINKHSAAIKQIYRDYLQHIKQFKHNMKNAHQTFHTKGAYE